VFERIKPPVESTRWRGGREALFAGDTVSKTVSLVSGLEVDDRMEVSEVSEVKRGRM
jgi:hypothetical protein